MPLVELDTPATVTVRGCPTSPNVLVSTTSSAADYTINGTNTAASLPFSVNPANNNCIIVLTKSLITSGNTGDPTKVSVDWSPTAGDASTATGLSFAVTDTSAPCTNC